MKLQLLLCVILLTSCQSVKSAAIIDKTMLSNKTELNGIWALNSINGEALNTKILIKKAILELDISNNRVSGNDGCNRFTGKIDKVDTLVLVFSKFIGTEMACPNMEVSSAINQALRQVQSYKIEDSQLFLYDANKKEVLNYKQDLKKRY